MSYGRGVFSGLVGVFRFITIVIGIVDFGFTVDSFLHHYKNEEFFLSVVIIALVLSSIISIIGFFTSCKTSKFDIIYHIITSGFLAVGGILMLYSVFSHGFMYSRWYYTERITSGILGVVNAVFYGSIAWLLMYNS